jgi:hypothetical protein
MRRTRDVVQRDCLLLIYYKILFWSDTSNINFAIDVKKIILLK